MGRRKATEENTAPKYRMTQYNPIEDTESQMDFPSIPAIVEFLGSKHLSSSKSSVQGYIAGTTKPPAFFTFDRIGDCGR